MADYRPDKRIAAREARETLDPNAAIRAVILAEQRRKGKARTGHRKVLK